MHLIYLNTFYIKIDTQIVFVFYNRLQITL